MSRVGKSPINIPAGVEISVAENNLVTVKGPKGTLVQKVDSDLKLVIADGVLTLERPTEQKRHKAMHGLYRSLLNNMVEGVSNGFKVQQELVGVGFKASNQGQILDLSLGYSHGILMEIPKEVSVTTETVKGKNPLITLESADKQLIGQVAAKIRSLRKPEPYKGKGIRFVGEVIRRKAGKSAGKK
ncbi:MAG: 50S ribosomal protein L6 [Bacteroidota bacterium]|nr:50S ribosomal protein L6 [Bacteroidota bacterium]MDX5431423.1 50S ribosomal protein L6 [Bacteroidota bacterium]MDX5470151.1 50S ribosomal protein L6 [Bacteroidota bacterium]